MNIQAEETGKVLMRCKHSSLIVELEVKNGKPLLGTVLVGDGEKFQPGYKSMSWNLFEFSRMVKH